MGCAQRIRDRRCSHDLSLVRKPILNLHGAYRPRRGLRHERIEKGDPRMNRRELLKMITAVTGTAMIGGTVVGGAIGLSGCTTAPTTPISLTTADIALLDEVEETIMPRTDT